MGTRSRRRYSAEFKEQTVELAEAGRPVIELSQELGVSEGLIYKWVRKARAAQPGSAGDGAAGTEAEADELRRLRKENEQLRLENDILKKAAVIIGSAAPEKGGR